MSTLVVTNANMYALALISVLEGSSNLRNTSEQLKVAAVIINRVNSANWRNEFGGTIIAQVMATNSRGQRQFVVIDDYHVVHDDFNSINLTVARLNAAKRIDYARDIVRDFVQAIGSPDTYSAARTAIGGMTGFHAGGSGNVFTEGSSTNDRDLAARHPSSVVPELPIPW